MHFDFGRELRRAVTGDGRAFAALTGADVETVQRALVAGALLEDREFHIARKILEAFLAGRRPGPTTLVVLNGLPLHVGQARDVATLVRVEGVVRLHCPPEVVLERSRTDAGADRRGRADDDVESVRRRLALFEKRTDPLVEHYCSLGCRVVAVDVTAAATADETWSKLNSRWDD
jgi:adenylate kinase